MSPAAAVRPAVPGDAAAIARVHVEGWHAGAPEGRGDPLRT